VHAAHEQRILGKTHGVRRVVPSTVLRTTTRSTNAYCSPVALSATRPLWVASRILSLMRMPSGSLSVGSAVTSIEPMMLCSTFRRVVV
jgi:hypothetical protein